MIEGEPESRVIIFPEENGIANETIRAVEIDLRDKAPVKFIERLEKKQDMCVIFKNIWMVAAIILSR